MRRSQPTVAVEAVPWQRFVALGDSITEGILGDPVDGYRDVGWVDLVADYLRAGRPDLEFVNLGERFLTTAQIKEKQLQPALALKPDLVSVVAGGNDLLKRKFDPEGVGRDLDEMVTAFTEIGATVFTCSMLNMPASGVMPADAVEWLQPRIDAIRDVVIEVARKHDTLFVDFWSHPISADPTIYSSDLQHANRRGHTFVAEAVVDCLVSGAASRF